MSLSVDKRQKRRTYRKQYINHPLKGFLRVIVCFIVIYTLHRELLHSPHQKTRCWLMALVVDVITARRHRVLLKKNRTVSQFHRLHPLKSAKVGPSLSRFLSNNCVCMGNTFHRGQLKDFWCLWFGPKDIFLQFWHDDVSSPFHSVLHSSHSLQSGLK